MAPDGVYPVSAHLAALAQTRSMAAHSLRLGGPLPDMTKVAIDQLATAVSWHTLGEWDALGPGNIGGRTRTLVIHPTEPEVMYAGGVSGGLWKTVDGGQNWRPIGDDLANIAVNALALHPEEPDLVVVGTGEGYFREEVRGTWLPLRGAGIFISPDGGATWERSEATAGPDFHWVNDLVWSPHDRDRLYAATRTGVWVSGDRGASWSPSLDSAVKGGCLDLAVRGDASADWVFAACGTLTDATVWRRKWTSAADWEPVLSEPGMGRTTLAIAPSRPRTIYALSATNLPGPGGASAQGLHAVFRSDTGGDAGSWTATVRNTDDIKLHTLLLTNPAAAAYLDCGWYTQNVWVNMGWYCNTIAVDPADPDTVWAAGVDLFRSDDGGRSWGLASAWWLDRSSPAFVHADQHAIVFHPAYDGDSVRTLYVANDGGIFRTTDAVAPVAAGPRAVCEPETSQVRWQSLNRNLGITQFYHGAAYAYGSRYIGGTQDNGTVVGSIQSGHDGWRQALGGDGGYVAVDPSDERVIYAEWQNFHLNKSSDGGGTFAPATDGVVDSPTSFLFITPFIMDPNDPQRLWAGGRRLWRTDDGARTWAAASTFLGGGDRVSALAVAPGDSDRVLAGTTGGTVLRSSGATTAHDATSWRSSRPRAGFVSSLTWDPSRDDVVYATYAGFGGDHVWRSTDAGVSWEAVDGAGGTRVPDIPVHTLLVDPDDPQRLVIGTDLGVFVTTNGGASWMPENGGFAPAVTEALQWTTDVDGRPLLFAFTHGRGAWRTPVFGSRPPPRPAGRRATP
jgi:hypothetical protein